MTTTTEKREATANLQAMMEAYAKLGKPGGQHKILETMAGTWEAKVKSWPEPGAAPMESNGTSHSTMIMGGRFLREDFSGEMMGSPFHGLGITGYDNHSKTFESIWLDSASTSILVFKGSVSDGDKKLVMECGHEDVVRGLMKWRSVTRLLDDKTHIFEMYNTVGNGNEVKSMEITYTRKA